MKRTNIKLNLLIGFLLLTANTFSQSINFDKKSKQEIYEYEKTQDGIQVDTIKNFGILKNPHKDLNTLLPTKVYIFKRGKDDFDPQLHVWYHFDIKNEQIKAITYNWGLFNPSFNPTKEKDRVERLMKTEQKFKEKYKVVKEEIEKKFGKPFKSDIIADNESSYVEQAFWKDNEKIISVSINFCRKLQEIQGFIIGADFHVDVMITYK